MSAAQVRSHGALHSAIGNGITPSTMASGDANDSFVQELGLLLRGKSRLESILGSRDLPQRSGSAPPSVEGSLSSMGGLLNNPSFSPQHRPSNLSRTGIGVSDDSELPTDVSANERELRSDPAYVAYYHSHVNLNPRLPPPLIPWDKYRYSQQLQSNFDDSLLLGASRLPNSEQADLSKMFSPRVSFQTRKELASEGDKLGLAFGVLGDQRNEISDWASEPKGTVHDPSLGIAVRPKSLVDLIQEDFPRTPSPVYTHSRTPSRAGHLEDVADSLDFQLSHIRDSINSSEAIHSPSLLNSPQGLSLHSRSTTPKPINGLSNLSTASVGGTSTLNLTAPISRASSPLPQILTNRTASPRVSDQNGATQAFLASRHVNDANASVVAELAAALQTISLQASQNSIPSVEELQDQITQHQQIQHQQHLQEQPGDKGDFDYEIQNSQSQVQSSLRQRLLDQELQNSTITDQDLQRQGPFPVKSSLQQQLNRSQIPRQHQNQSQANQSLTDPAFQHLSALDNTLRNNANLASRYSLNDTPNLAQNLPTPILQAQQQAAAAAAAMYSMAANPYFQNAQANAAAAAAASIYAPQFAAMGMGNFHVSPMMAAYPPTIPMGFDSGSPPTALTPQSPLSGIRPTMPGMNSLNPLFKYGTDGGSLGNVSPQFLPLGTSDPIYLSYMQQRAMEEARGGNAMSLSPMYFGSPPSALLSLSNPSIPGSPVSANVLNSPLTQITSSPSRRGDERGKGRGVHTPGSTYAGWHTRAEGGSGGGGGDSMDFRCSSLLEEFKNNKTRRFELQDIVNHVVEFSVDQHGSRFIQQKLEVSLTEDKDLVFQEVKPHALTLMTDVFGNYVIQKFFEHGSDQHRAELSSQLTGHVLALSLQMYGCRVIQKALEVVELEQQMKVVSELDGHVMRCVRDQNGNHVIQKCIECVPSEHIAFIIQSFYGQVVALSTHPYGCRVIQRVLEHCNDEPKQKAIMAEILRSTCTLAQDQYGNYVVQHVLEHGNNQERSEIITKLAGQIVQMSQHKFASNVIEKCLEFGGPTERQILINEMLGHTDENEPLQAMMKDQFANYVVQKVLETCNDYQREMLLGRIKVHLHALKKYTYGKHIVARVEKLVTTGGRIQSRNDHSREKDLSSRNELLMT